MASERFFRIADELLELETRINNLSKDTSVHLTDITADELKRLWLKVIDEYNVLMDTKELEGKEDIKTKYIECYDAYLSVATLLKVLAEPVPPPAEAPQLSSTTHAQPELPLAFYTQLPPCDRELFHGDYHSWPTFRELFRAIYINDPRLSPVQKFVLESEMSECT